MAIRLDVMGGQQTRHTPTSLWPDIKLAILKGTQPPEMTVQALIKTETLPVAFDEQRRRWGFGG